MSEEEEKEQEENQEEARQENQENKEHSENHSAKKDSASNDEEVKISFKEIKKESELEKEIKQDSAEEFQTFVSRPSSKQIVTSSLPQSQTPQRAVPIERQVENVRTIKQKREISREAREPVYVSNRSAYQTSSKISPEAEMKRRQANIRSNTQRRNNQMNFVNPSTSQPITQRRPNDQLLTQQDPRAQNINKYEASYIPDTNIKEERKRTVDR